MINYFFYKILQNGLLAFKIDNLDVCQIINNFRKLIQYNLYF